MSEVHRAVLAQYLQRQPGSDRPGPDHLLGEWARALHGLAAEAAAQLAFAARAHASVQLPQRDGEPAEPGGAGPGSAPAEAAAAAALCAALEQLQHASETSSGAFGAGTVHVLEQCSLRLQGIIAGAGRQRRACGVEGVPEPPL